MSYTVVIILTFFGFIALAAMLLIPVYRFLKREEEAAKKWTLGEKKEEDRVTGDGSEGEAPI